MSYILIPNDSDGNPEVIDIPEGYHPMVTHRGGYVHNGAECSIQQTNVGAFSSVLFNGVELTYQYILDGYPFYSHVGGATIGRTIASGDRWEVRLSGVLEDFSDVDTAYPPETGWSTATIVHNDSSFGGPSFWGDGTSWDKKTKAQLDTHFNNTNGSYNLWLKYVGDNTYESVQYPLDKEFTPAEVVKNENYFGGTSGALRDVDGDFILDVDGYVIFTA